jgi:hypothetical protein
MEFGPVGAKSPMTDLAWRVVCGTPKLEPTIDMVWCCVRVKMSRTLFMCLCVGVGVGVVLWDQNLVREDKMGLQLCGAVETKIRY